MDQNTRDDAKYSLKSSSKRTKRIVVGVELALLLFFIALVISHPLAAFVLGRRFNAKVQALKAQGDPVSMSEFVGKSIPEDQNGAVVFSRIFKRLQQKNAGQAETVLDNLIAYEKRLNSGSSSKISSVSWRDINTAAQYFQDIVPVTQQALERPVCKFPVDWNKGIEAKFPHLSRLRRIVRILSGSAINDAHLHRMDAALEKINLAFRTSGVVKREPTLISILVTLANTRVANRSLQAVLKYQNPTEAQADKLYDMLSKIDFRQDYVYSLKGERVSGLWLFENINRKDLLARLDSVGTGNAEKPTVLQSRNTIYWWRPVFYADASLYLKRLSRDIEAAGKPYRDAYTEYSKYESDDIPRYAIISQMLVTETSRSSVRVDVTHAEISLTQILLAVEIFKKHHGSYPGSMSQLKSRTNWSIPQDPFSGRDFIYKRTAKGFQVYSVGPNFINDGGKPLEYGQYTNAGDIVLNWEN